MTALTWQKKKKENHPLNESYLRKVGVGVEATLVAHHGAALCAGVACHPRARQICGFADRAQFAAGHRSDLRHRVRGGGDASSVWGHRRRPSSPGATQVHLQILPGNMTLALLSLRCSMLRGVMRSQPVAGPMAALDSGFWSRVWWRRSGKENKFDIRPGMYFESW